MSAYVFMQGFVHKYLCIYIGDILHEGSCFIKYVGKHMQILVFIAGTSSDIS